MSDVHIYKSSPYIKGRINLPGSKSLSNRVLMIKAMCEGSFEIANLSDSDDTLVLKSLLEKISGTHSDDIPVLDCHDAGTVARFLLSFLALTSVERYVLTGSERLQERPMADLTDALIKMGSQIEFLKKKGFLPLEIIPPVKIKSEVSLNCETSSQFASSLLLVAPILPKGLKLELTGHLASKPYLDMTLSVMSDFGIVYKFEDNIIHIPPQKYQAVDFYVEPDWSAVACWYQMAAMSKDCNIVMENLKCESKQGDSILTSLYQKLGVETKEGLHGLELTKTNRICDRFEFNFVNNPDLFPSLAVCCTMLNIPARLQGLNNLKHKESNRVDAVINELRKMNANIRFETDTSEVIINPAELKPPETAFETYNDHRIAMALAPCALIYDNIILKNPNVVKKSYPGFWLELKKCGFNINTTSK
ncbi:MAG: 3-phosphoshikimate 1-carboxyvinyltransferase [Bacteroidales bacterium]|nr:3-phosphoshikimate 1-carboxyvinyltransferase [Bacteroidales bacterium]